MKFIITEKQNENSQRVGVQIDVKSLTAAKRYATKSQCFIGTILVIESVEGHTLAVKEKNGKWVEERFLAS